MTKKWQKNIIGYQVKIKDQKKNTYLKKWDTDRKLSNFDPT